MKVALPLIACLLAAAGCAPTPLPAGTRPVMPGARQFDILPDVAPATDTGPDASLQVRRPSLG